MITDELLRELPEIRRLHVGLAFFFLKHCSASLSINENADPTVRQDLEAYLNRTVPEGAAYFRHTLEGDDDMPAHVKCSLIGCSVTVPIESGRLALGTWQGITLGEHRDAAGSRSVVVTLQGETD